MAGCMGPDCTLLLKFFKIANTYCFNYFNRFYKYI